MKLLQGRKEKAPFKNKLHFFWPSLPGDGPRESGGGAAPATIQDIILEKCEKHSWITFACSIGMVHGGWIVIGDHFQTHSPFRGNLPAVGEPCLASHFLLQLVVSWFVSALQECYLHYLLHLCFSCGLSWEEQIKFRSGVSLKLWWDCQYLFLFLYVLHMHIEYMNKYVNYIYSNHT